MRQSNVNEKEVFLEAVDYHSPHEMREYLDRTCAGNPRLRTRVEDLLHAHGAVGNFLAGSIDPVSVGDEVIESPGSEIGPYKLLKQLGEGGMGVVFMAEQTNPVRRIVALKIIKPGMDTRQVVARFEAEREALAMMAHPNIAGVLDAGATSTGRPYFVMDLVPGIPITEYADDRRLSIEQRLRLFIPVCQAVQHAHQKGIIHRDLKPSNVLVAEYDGGPAPKVIDFGVAKATGTQPVERTQCTRMGQIIGTLEYMSPEQARLNHTDVDTRSDIYSLGVLLYELLTSETPIDRPQLQAAPFHEILRIVREDDPASPSARVSTSSSLEAIAACREQEPARLVRMLRGELDWIVAKALDKDRNRRYDSAAALATDLTCYLNGDPVAAAAPSRSYCIRNLVRRHKWPVIAAAAIFLGLVAGIIGSTVALVSQTSQRKIAMRERAEAEFNLADNLKSQLQYAQAEQLYRQGLKSPSDTPQDRQRIARTLLHLGQVVSSRHQREQYYREALNAYRSAFPAKDPSIAHALTTLALLLRDQNRVAESLPFFQDAYDIQRTAQPVNHLALGAAATNLGHVYYKLGDYPASEKMLREGIAEYRLDDSRNGWSIALAQLELGRTLGAMRRFPEAESVLLDAERGLTPVGNGHLGGLALAGMYTSWNKAQPQQGYDAKAQEWFHKLIKDFVPPERDFDNGDSRAPQPGAPEGTNRAKSNQP